ncbi:uncharacterized protein LOC141912490 isoform X1 [Tubulanus polymorphus]|uniref:uncharacterized protein LOC141912490 isoform X1 n=1 Tax=Tubulanus polymorphus TaxID=672921 RepID=UPI003DA45787
MSFYDRMMNSRFVLHTLLGIGVGVLIYKSRKDRARRNAIQQKLNSIPPGLSYRQCDVMESSLDVAHRVGGLIDTNVLFIESDREIGKELVQKSVDLLWDRYIMLRLKVLTVDTGARILPRFLVEMERSPVKCRVELRDGNDWKQVFESEILRPLDCDDGPLWRVCMLNVDEFKYAFVFTFHHAIVDGAAIMQILTEFQRNIDVLLRGVEPQMPDDYSDHSQVITPNLSEMLKNDPRYAWSISDVTTPLRLSKTMSTPDTGLAGELSRTLGPKGSIEYKTSIEEFELSEVQSSALRKKCKEMKCTVHGACTAAAALALRKLAQLNDIEDEYLRTFPTSLNVSMRRYVNAAMNGRLGNFISIIGLPVMLVKPGSQTPVEFWELARESTEQVHLGLNDGLQFLFTKMLKLMRYFGSDRGFCDMWSGGGDSPRHKMFNISNRGLFKNVPGERVTRITGVYWATAEHSCPMGRFTHNVVSLDDKMYWSVTNYLNVTRRESARQYADLIKSILVENIIRVE